MKIQLKPILNPFNQAPKIPDFSMASTRSLVKTEDLPCQVYLDMR